MMSVAAGMFIWIKHIIEKENIKSQNDNKKVDYDLDLPNSFDDERKVKNEDTSVKKVVSKSEQKNDIMSKLKIEEGEILYFRIKGINSYKKNLKIGRQPCVVVQDRNNEYDDYAIAVFSEDKKIVGYLPKGQKRIYNLLEKEKNLFGVMEIRQFVAEDGREPYVGDLNLLVGFTDDELDEMIESFISYGHF